jgi:uncharacterized protein
MLHEWSTVTFLHWPYGPPVLQRLLPRGLEVESVDGQAWVGLVPFRMRAVRIPGVPAVPWLSQFPETNVRTYVRGPDGQSAIWFFSLDAARLPAVLAANGTAARLIWDRVVGVAGGSSTVFGRSDVRGLVLERAARRLPGRRDDWWDGVPTAAGEEH